MDLREKFLEADFYPKLQDRGWTFSKMIAHLDKVCRGERTFIIETGCARNEDNWGGDGLSTFIWDWAIKEMGPSLKCFSIDFMENHIKMCREHTKYVEFICSDSVKALNNISRSTIGECKLLYLDSFDYSPEAAVDSMCHHLSELTAVWSHLPSGCMIAVDDRKSRTSGKHAMVQYFMDKLGIPPEFEEYQIAWVKP